MMTKLKIFPQTLFVVAFVVSLTASCSRNPKQEARVETKKLKMVRAIVNTDSCLKWGFEPIHFELEYPENYTAEYNSDGGYYLLLRQNNGDTAIHEIGFGNAKDLNVKKFRDNMRYIDSSIKEAIEGYGQRYTSTFIGTADFLGHPHPQIRSTLVYRNITPPGQNVILNGTYSAVLTCVSSRDSTSFMTISLTSNIKDPLDGATGISISNLEILKTLRLN